MIVCSVLVLIVLVGQPNNLKGLGYVPNAISGLVTIASILSGFSGFLLTYAYTSRENVQFRKWVKLRVVGIAVVAFLGFLSITASFLFLVDNELVVSFKAALIGWFLMVYLLEESFLAMLSDEADYSEKENF